MENIKEFAEYKISFFIFIFIFVDNKKCTNYWMYDLSNAFNCIDLPWTNFNGVSNIYDVSVGSEAWAKIGLIKLKTYYHMKNI